MHQPGSKPKIADGIFAPFSRLVDPSYDRAAAERAVRRAHAEKFRKGAARRQWVNELDVVVDIGSGARAFALRRSEAGLIFADLG